MPGPSKWVPSGFPTKTLYAPPSRPHTCYMPRPSHSSRLHNRVIFGEYRSLSSTLCSFLHFPVTSSLLSTLFTSTLILRSSFSVSDHVLHPYKTIGKIILMYISIFICLDNLRSVLPVNFRNHLTNFPRYFFIVNICKCNLKSTKIQI